MTKGETADDYRKWDERGRAWIYGFVWFEQRKDRSISRGYMQVSEERSIKEVLMISNVLLRLSSKEEYRHSHQAALAVSVHECARYYSTSIFLRGASSARLRLSFDCRLVSTAVHSLTATEIDRTSITGLIQSKAKS
jgi:hypothetical protein